MSKDRPFLWVLILALLGALAPRIADVRTTAASSQERPGGTPASPGPTSRLPETGATTLLARMLVPDIEPRTATLESVQEAVRGRQIPVRFLVATLPDPVNSHTGWLFDPLLDALQGAAAASGFVLDRHSLPWKAPGDSSTRRAAAEQEPGVVLLRRSASPPELLVLFLVGETPTYGIQSRALLSALDYVNRWHGAEPAAISILGPSFSGSEASLVTAIQRWSALPTTRGSSKLRIVSGSATSVHRDLVEDAIPGRRVTFRATVMPDSCTLQAAVSHLSETYGMFSAEPGRSRSTAVLVESNTDYGRFLSAYLQAGPGEREQRDCQRAHPAPPRHHGKQRGAIILPFPLHIAKLRTAYESLQAQPRQASPAGAGLRLSLEESADAADVLPTYHVPTTSREADLALSNILDVLKRERVRHVGLLATDSRDKLFLAQRISGHRPDVTLFTLESDLFYSHVDYGRYMRGALVVSSYPALSDTQAWSRRPDWAALRRQFPTTNAQGVYNATLALVSYTHEGSPIDPKAPPLLDYSPVADAACGSSGCQPSLWFSVVGRGSIWPLKVERLTGRAVDDYLQAWVPPAPSPATAEPWPPIHPSESLVVVLVGLTLLALVHLVAYGYEQWRPHPMHAATHPYHLVCLGLLFGLYALTAYPIATSTGLLSWAWLGMHSFLPAQLAIVVCGLGLILGTGHSGVSCVRSVRSGAHALSRRGPPDMQERVGLALLAGMLLLGGVALLHFLIFVGAQVNTLRTDGRGPWLLFVDRAAHPENGVSPLAPLLLLGLAFYGAAVLQLRRLQRPVPVLATKDFWSLGRLTRGGIEREQTELEFMTGTRALSLPPWRLSLVVLLLVVFAFLLSLGNRLSTAEGRDFDFGFELAFLLIHALVALSLLRFVCLWASLKRVLSKLAAHPHREAYGRIAPELRRSFGNRYSPSLPSALELAVPLRAARRMAAGAAAASGELLSRFGADISLLQPLLDQADAADAQLAADAGSGSAWSATPTWGYVLSLAEATIEALDGVWRRASPWRGDAPEAAKPLDAASEWLDQAEQLVASTVALCVREVLYHLRSSLYFVLVGILLMLGVVSSYPFQPLRQLLGFPWVGMLCVVGAIMAVFVQIDRDEIISRICGTPPGHISWDWTFLSATLTYAVLPLVTLFAAEFPEAGRFLLSILTPVQRAIP